MKIKHRLLEEADETGTQQVNTDLSAEEQAVNVLMGKDDEKPDTDDLETDDEVEAKADEDADLETGDEADEADESDEVEAYKLENLAEKLGVEAEDVYNIEVPIADGETATISELKDAYKDVEAINTERETLEHTRVTQQNEQLAARDQITKLVSLLGDQVPDELWQAVEDIQGQEVAKAGESMLAAIPDWKEPAAVKADMTAMGEHLKSYGFTAADLGRVMDSRLMVYIRDNMRKEKLAKEAKAKLAASKKPAKHLKGKKPDTAKTAAHARLHKAAKAGNKDAQTELAANLISGVQ